MTNVSDDADGDDRVVNAYGSTDHTESPERDALCIEAIAPTDDRNVSVTDGCLGFLARLSLQRQP